MLLFNMHAVARQYLSTRGLIVALHRAYFQYSVEAPDNRYCFLLRGGTHQATGLEFTGLGNLADTDKTLGACYK